MKKINKILTPLMAVSSTAIASFGLVGCNKMKNLTQEILDEFIGNSQKQINGVVNVPRPGGYHVKIVPYLQSRIKAITGLEDKDIHVQAGGVDNIYFDLPASKGLEDKDMVILQGHTDMVVAGMSEEDAKKQPISVVVENNTVHSSNYLTSIGADNGMGIATMLTIAKHTNDFKHGPLRFLMTADEDIGMVGAQALDPNWLVDPQGQKIKWLINIDAEQLGCVYKGCAGNIRLIFSKNYETTIPLEDGQELVYYQAYIGGLKGGHSAFDILFKRANADKLAFMMLNDLVNYAQQSNKIVRLVSMDHCELKDGTNIKYSANQLIANSHIVFATDIADSTVRDIFLNTIKKCNADKDQPYTGEVWDDVNKKSTIQLMTGSQKVRALTQDDTKTLAQLIGFNDTKLIDKLSSLYFGVFDDIKANDMPQAPNASGNVGPFELVQSDIENIVHLSGWTSCRSSVKDQTSKLSIDWIKEQYTVLARAAGFKDMEFTNGPIYYPWPEDKNNQLTPLLVDGYTKNGVEPFTYSSPGGVEPAWWYEKSEGAISCGCIGPTIDDAHSVNETLHIDTIEPVIKTTIYALEQLATK